VVPDIDAAEIFFKQVIGVSRFMRFQDMRAADVEGTYHGRPGDWVCHIAIGYAGETQIELVQHVSGTSLYADFARDQGFAIQHVGYVMKEGELEAAAARLVSAGYQAIQTANTRIGRFAYFDTRASIGMVTELIGLNGVGDELFRSLKGGALDSPAQS
jgi:Glyoxalase/Bleomycin resistance protein/Dioxygenase superfamily